MPSFNDSQITSIITTLDNNILKISGTSLVFENYWLSFNGASFDIKNYVNSSVTNARTRFFLNRDYAVFLMIGLDKLGNLTVVEGTQVKYPGIVEAVPPPTKFAIIPLVGLVLIQSGSTDLSSFKEVSAKNIFKFSGSGNIVDKNKEGNKGFDSLEYGDTGVIGYTGIQGFRGLSGELGNTGYKGPTVLGDTGYTGLQGMTGISWDIHFPLTYFI